MKREYRVLKAAQVRAKADGNQIEGYAAVFNQPSEDLGGFTEVIKPGAFANALSSKQDVRCLFNHDANVVLGRTASGTLTLAEDNTGLHFVCDLPDTQSARDIKASIARGDVSQCSFGFCANEQEWNEEKQADGSYKVIRSLIDVDLFDVSPVTYPCYPQTAVSARALWPDGEPLEITEHRAKSEKTKRVDGEDLTADCFAYVGDPDLVSTWKFPIKFSDEEKTKTHIRNAIARSAEEKDIPASEKDKVWQKIVAAAEKYGIHVSDEEQNSRDVYTETAIIRLCNTRLQF